MDRKIQDQELRLLCKVRLLVDTQIRANPNRKTNISDTRACLSKHCIHFRAKVVHEVSSTTGNLRAIVLCLCGLNELRIKFEPIRFATANTVQSYCGGTAFLVEFCVTFDSSDNCCAAVTCSKSLSSRLSQIFCNYTLTFKNRASYI